MLSITAWTWQFTFTVCLAANADFELPGGLFGIFGFGKGLSKAEAPLGSRFLAVRHYRADESASDKRDDLRAQFEVLNTDRYDRLLMSARRKRELAADARAAARRSGQHNLETAHGEGTAGEEADEASALHAFDTRKAALLEVEARRLEDEARRIKELVEAVKVSASNGKQSLVTECEILKIGPLTFVTNNKPRLVCRVVEDDVKDDTTLFNVSNMAQVSGSALTIYHMKELKNTYFLDGVELPIKAVEDSSNCFAFHYRGSEQVLCAASPVARDSWIDALSEAWFCRHTGLKGTLPSVQQAEKEAKLEAIPPPPPPKEAEKSPKAAVNVDFSVDDRRQFLVKVNGLEQPIGEYMAFDVEKFTKQGGQPQEQAVSQAAADVSKRALKVTERIKEAASHQPSPLHKEAETESPDELEDASTEEPGSSDEERGESQEEEATNDERLEGQNDEDVDMD